LCFKRFSFGMLHAVRESGLTKASTSLPVAATPNTTIAPVVLNQQMASTTRAMAV